MKSKHGSNPNASSDAQEGACVLACASGAEVGEVATPSNTATDKCIELKFVPLRWGVDSLYLSYPGMLADSVNRELDQLKKKAQSDLESDQSAAIYPVGAHVFEVRDKGTGLFSFILRDNAFRLSLSRPSSGKVPMAYVQLSSQFLSANPPLQAECKLREVLESMGDIEPAKVSRVDLFVDFVTRADMESWDRHAWVTRAHQILAYSIRGRFSGWSIGMGGVIAARLYDKTLEIESSGKDYLKALWKEAGWDGESPVWRLEFEFKREFLGQKELVTLDQVMSHLGSLWNYATTEWLRLTVPNDQDETRSRWQAHPLWECLSAIPWGQNGGPLLDRFSSISAPSEKYTLTRLFSSLTTWMATEGIIDLYDAWNGLLDRLDDHLFARCMYEGVSPAQYIEEQVRLKARKYNILLDRQADSAPDLDELAALYRKQSDGE